MVEKLTNFANDILAVCKKHGVVLDARHIRIATLDEKRVKPDTVTATMADEVSVHGACKDTYGPFLVMGWESEPEPEVAGLYNDKFKQDRLVIIDREKPMGDGVESPITGEFFTSRRTYEDHLKDEGCEIIGNDYTGRTKPPWLQE